MIGKTIALIGGPETGKTNFLARLWTSLRKGNGALSSQTIPEDIVYVEDAVKHLLVAEFAPRTQQPGISGTLEIPIEGKDGANVSSSVLKVPDVMGEEWDKVVHDREVKSEILEVLNEADGALLFVRILSDLNVAPLDWVTARHLLGLPFEQKETTGKLPTQVALCELLSILEFTSDPNREPRKVAVIVTGWDLLDAEAAAKGPMAYLEGEFPLFAGRIKDASSLEVNLYGFSVVGGDLNDDEAFKQKFLEKDLNQTGFVVHEVGGKVSTSEDITEPLRWLLAS
ncbi:hypothetical protein [Sulfitobacter sp. SK011]|uniref:TRAFAC clade GTPase domain-containing protein n=1 Tax=Sulfitobacter sp. SK011 TaxID=1389004 RepID=UPI000E0C4B5B|nr:hypothetical protein [Sulfitobacter sp. SK011]AXI42581.1 hypothetical protein C1J02_11985 [Sulfitobacter sp. SK011]